MNRPVAATHASTVADLLAPLIEIDDRLTVGRDEKNDLVLSDEQRGISTEHCRI